MEVDAITEGMVLDVIAGTETGDNWWLREPVVNVDSPGGGGPPDGALTPTPPGGLIVALLVLRLARLAESSRQQEPR